MSTLTRRSLALAITVIAALALVASACSDSDPDSTTTETAPTTVATTASPTNGDGDDDHDHVDGDGDDDMLDEDDPFFVPINDATGCNTAEAHLEGLAARSVAGVNAGRGGSAAGCVPVCVLEFPANPASIGVGDLKEYKLYADYGVAPHELAAVTEQQYIDITSLGEDGTVDQATALTVLLDLVQSSSPVDAQTEVPNTDILGKKMLFKSPHEVYFLGLREPWQPPFIGSGSIGFLLEPLGGIKGIRISEDQQSCETYDNDGNTLDVFTSTPFVPGASPTDMCNLAEVHFNRFYFQQRAGVTAGISGSNAGCVPACVLQFPDDPNNIAVSAYKEYRLYPDFELDRSELITITQEQNDEILALTDTTDALPVLVDLIPNVVGGKMFFKTPQEVYFLLELSNDNGTILAHGNISFMLETIAGIKEIRTVVSEEGRVTCEAYDSSGELLEDFFSGAPEPDDA